MPDHLEAGTGNAPGLAGLLAGCEYLLQRGVDAVHRHESELKAKLRVTATDAAGNRTVERRAISVG